MSENRLLDAVDALTKPVRRMRIVESDHDHDWLAVTITRTHKELRALKEAGEEKPEKTIRTGEWWCPWCDEVVVTPDRREPSTGTIRREDPPLLDQLEAATVNGMEATGGSRPPAERSPAALAALQLVIDIRGELVAWMGEQGGRVGSGLSLAEVLRSWYKLQLGSVRVEDAKAGILRSWEGRIKRMLEPEAGKTEILEICPSCEFAFVLTADGRKHALEGTNADTYEGTSVECLVCGARWQGFEELHQLGNATRRLRGMPELESAPLSA
jgi:hypothetical protein